MHLSKRELETISDHGQSQDANRASHPPPPTPTIPIDYYSARVREPEPWVTIARFATTAQWHQARALLARGQIESLMGDGEDISECAQRFAAEQGIALAVRQSKAQRAQAVLRVCRSGKRWCPRCGSDDLREVPLPWYWVIWSIIFLGIAPFAPPRWICRRCGRRID